MKVIDAAKANQIAAINAAVKFELKDMQLPAITIEGKENEKVKIPRLGEEALDSELSKLSNPILVIQMLPNNYRMIEA